MRYKAVLFDMDGTVLDTLADLTNAVNHTLFDYGMPLLDKRQVAQYLGNGAAYLMSRAVPAGTPDALREEMLRAYQPWYDSHCAILTAPYPGILPLMRALREAGVKQAVISNKQDTAVKQLAAQHFPAFWKLPSAKAPLCAANRTRMRCLQRCGRWALTRRTPSMSATPRSTCAPPKTRGLPARWWAGAFARKSSFMRPVPDTSSAARKSSLAGCWNKK